MTLFPTSGFSWSRPSAVRRTPGWLAQSCMVVLVLAGLTLNSVRPASATESAQQFVNTLAEKALAIVQADATPTENRAEFSKILDSFFDMRGIAQFLAGRYWRGASEADQEAYFKAFHTSIVNTYTSRFGDYSGQKLNVTGSRALRPGQFRDRRPRRPNASSQGRLAPLADRRRFQGGRRGNRRRQHERDATPGIYSTHPEQRR